MSAREPSSGVKADRDHHFVFTWTADFALLTLLILSYDRFCSGLLEIKSLLEFHLRHIGLVFQYIVVLKFPMHYTAT
jgi:hypothetical protein